MQDLITAKDLEILTFIVEGGGVDVSMAASSVNQNKNFYMRVRKLENMCLFSRKNLRVNHHYSHCLPRENRFITKC